MRSKFYCYFLVVFLISSIAVNNAEAQSSDWIKSLGYRLTAFSGLDFQEWDYTLIPTTTLWAVFDNQGVVIWGPRTTLPMNSYPACGGVLPFAFISNYYSLTNQLIATRYECAFTNGVFVNLSPVGLGLQSGLKYCSGICP